jgi:hypothetical protein
MPEIEPLTDTQLADMHERYNNAISKPFILAENMVYNVFNTIDDIPLLLAEINRFKAENAVLLAGSKWHYAPDIPKEDGRYLLSVETMGKRYRTVNK